MTAERPGATSRLPPSRRAWLVLAVLAALAAFLARLIPVLRGGGLAGLGNYDDGVYYVAGTALTHGLLPYRNFLFLHPPGVVLATMPFGVLGRVLSDPAGLAAARLSWMLLGAVNTVLVARIVRPLGLLPAALGALVYAFSYAAIYTEWTTLLVAPAQTCVLVAVLLLAARPTDPRVALLLTLGAGALLGASTTFKIWGVAAIAAVAIWFLLSGAWRRALTLLAGSALAITLICLPFFLTAPRAMWRMVVLYQLDRDASGVPLATRLAGIVGMGLDQPRVQTFTPVLIAVWVLVLALLGAAALVREARVSIALTVVLIAVLLLSPSWFLHYPGLVAGPLAVALACGAAQIITWAGSRRRVVGVGVAVLLAVPVLAQAYRQRNLELGLVFPGSGMARAVAATPGCVSSDDPASLAAMNTLTRNLRRACPFIADFSGYSYQLAYERGRWVSRPRDPAWQQMYLGYLRTGTVALSWRYPRADALSPATRETITDWPRYRRIDRFTLREPR